MRNKLDKTFMGAIIGLIVPMIAFGIIYILNKDDIRQFGDMFVAVNLHTSAFTIGLLPNLGFFYLFIKMNMNQTARGILLVTFVYLITFLLLFFNQ